MIPTTLSSPCVLLLEPAWKFHSPKTYELAFVNFTLMTSLGRSSKISNDVEISITTNLCLCCHKARCSPYRSTKLSRFRRFSVSYSPFVGRTFVPNNSIGRSQEFPICSISSCCCAYGHDSALPARFSRRKFPSTAPSVLQLQFTERELLFVHATRAFGSCGHVRRRVRRRKGRRIGLVKKFRGLYLWEWLDLTGFFVFAAKLVGEFLNS